jgi:hypothetical protein
MAWTLRVALDALLLFLLAARILPDMRAAQIQVAMGISGLSVLMGGISTIDLIAYKILAFGGICLSATVLGGGGLLWRRIQARNTANLHQSASLLRTREP